MNRKKTVCLALIAAAFSAFGWNAAVAEDKAEVKELVKTGYKTSPDGEGNLTKEMIETCIQLKMTIDADFVEIKKTKDQFTALNKETTELGAYLKENGEKVNKEGDQAAREAYDAKAKEYNAKLPDLDAKLKAYTAMAETYEAKNAKFDKECNNQPYYEDDYKEIETKLGRGM
jgi:hypothetical protein